MWPTLYGSISPLYPCKVCYAWVCLVHLSSEACMAVQAPDRIIRLVWLISSTQALWSLIRETWPVNTCKATLTYMVDRLLWTKNVFSLLRLDVLTFLNYCTLQELNHWPLRVSSIALYQLHHGAFVAQSSNSIIRCWQSHLVFYWKIALGYISLPSPEKGFRMLLIN